MKLAFSTLLLGLTFVSCDKHEVIPAPSPLVDLKVHFEGSINGTDVEYTDDVDGFNGVATSNKYILGSSDSHVNYFCEMESNLISRSIKIGIGSLYWDAGALDNPSIEQFNGFFTNLKDNTGLTYGPAAEDGFEVTYIDNFGNQWVSSPTSVNPQTAVFSTIENESDNDGDYSKFTVNFSCYLYRIVTQTPLEIDSIRIDNGVFQGWFER